METDKIIPMIERKIGMREENPLRDRTEALLRRLKKTPEREELIFILLDTSRTTRQSGYSGKYICDVEKRYISCGTRIRNTLRYLNHAGIIIFKRPPLSPQYRKSLMFAFNFDNPEALFFWDTLKKRIEERLSEKCKTDSKPISSTTSETNSTSTSSDAHN